jgi:hypothetical protein
VKLRLAAGDALVCVAVLAALLAADLLGWRSAMRDGDRQFDAAPAEASWRASTVLPFDPARRVLGLGGDLALRKAAQDFEAVEVADTGFDYGGTVSQQRGEAELELAGIAGSPVGDRASAADNMLGILAYSDSRQNGPAAPAPVDRAVADFQAAVAADPSNDVAKFNLELLLYQLIARGTRHGGNGTNGGPSHGHRGAGGGTAGRGY